MWGQEEVGEEERREGDKLLQMYNLVGYCFAECVGMFPMTNCVLWSCHKMHSDTSTKQRVCQPIISLMFSSAHHHQITSLWTKMHEIFSSRMETPRTCFIKTLLFTFWNGQVNCMCSIFLLGNFFISDKDMNMTPGNPTSLSYLFQLVFGLYMLVTTVVLINLLIAMMSDTYQRIQVNRRCLVTKNISYVISQQQSDVEWKFGLAKLIRSMHRTDMSPSPINLVTTWLVYLFRVCRRGSCINEYSIVQCSMHFLEGKKSKVDDYSRLQESSSAKSGGMFKKSIVTQHIGVLSKNIV